MKNYEIGKAGKSTREDLKRINEENDILPEDTKVIEKGEPLFMRLDVEEEVEFIKEGMKK